MEGPEARSEYSDGGSPSAQLRNEPSATRATRATPAKGQPSATPAKGQPTTPANAQPSATPASRQTSAPPAPLKSLTIPVPKKLHTKPKLSDFRYLSTKFDAEPPSLDRDSSPKNLTAHLIKAILNGPRFNQANHFLLENQAVVRFFEPRQVLSRRGGYKPADYSLDETHHARAMAWYLLDSGSRPGQCTTCLSEQSGGPFKGCIVPDDPEAGGSCTNCWYMKRAGSCSHRPVQGRPVSPLKKEGEKFDGFTGKDMKEATNGNLAAWRERIEAELRLRSESQKVKTTRGPKRDKLED